MRRGIGSLPAAAIVGVQMAAGISAVCRCDSQGIVTVQVACSARNRRVSIGQRESGRGVIEDSSGPGSNRMAGRAGRRRSGETGRHMVRNISANRRRALERSRMASVAVRGVQGIIIGYVAGSARSRGRRHVRPRQSEAGNAMIEGCRRPARRRVARRAICSGKSRSRSGVDRGCSSLPGGQMALRISAIGRLNRQRIIAINVAQVAGHICVPIRQEESRGAVVENSSRPCRYRMACSASGCRSRKSSRDVIRNIPA